MDDAKLIMHLKMNHRGALRNFRSGATLASILPRISLVGHFADAHDELLPVHEKYELENKNLQENNTLQWKGLKNDLDHVEPTVETMYKWLEDYVDTEMGNSDQVPRNIYSNTIQIFDSSIFDRNTFPLDIYLMYRYAARQSVIGLSISDVPTCAANDMHRDKSKRDNNSEYR